MPLVFGRGGGFEHMLDHSPEEVAWLSIIIILSVGQRSLARHGAEHQHTGRLGNPGSETMYVAQGIQVTVPNAGAQAGGADSTARQPGGTRK